MTEKQFETKVKKFLKSHDIWFIKIWGGGFQRAGIPDIIACINGKFVAIELKGPTGKPTPLQEYNIARINECNGIGLILYPHQFSKFKELVKNLLGGE